MKTYVLMVSRHFPKGHSKEGKETRFIAKIMACKKLHTIRANYNLWAKRFEEINAGKACLSLRYWEGKPYRSKQIEFAKLTKDDGIGLQKLEHLNTSCFVEKNVYIEKLQDGVLANNDGLTLNDWEEWFKGYDKTKPMAIIHFTNFRY